MAQKKRQPQEEEEAFSSGYFRSMRTAGTVQQEPELLYENKNGYQVWYVNSDVELQQLFELRYEVYCVQMKSLDPKDYPDGVEVDAFDSVAAHFSGKMKGHVVGTSRLVFPVRGTFLMETSDEAFTLPDWIPRETTAESSRLIALPITDSKGHKIRQSLLLLEASCRWSLRHGLTHWVVASEKQFHDWLLEKGWPFISLGEPKMYHGNMTVPVCLELSALARWFDEQQDDQ